MRNFIKRLTICTLISSILFLQNGLCFSPTRLIRWFNQENHRKMEANQAKRIPANSSEGSIYEKLANVKSVVEDPKNKFYETIEKLHNKLAEKSPEIQKYMSKILSLNDIVFTFIRRHDGFFRKSAVESGIKTWENSYKVYQKALRNLTIDLKYLLKNVSVVCSDTDGAQKLRQMLRKVFNMAKEEAEFGLLEDKTRGYWNNYKHKIFKSLSKQKTGAYNEALLDRRGRNSYFTLLFFIKVVTLEFYKEATK